MMSPLHSQSTVSPLRRNAMSIRTTYYLAHTARGKLSHEAAQADHELRRLVGHANLLDSLMLELAEAEAEQESWFNNSVRGAQKSERAHIQWADAVVEEEEEEAYGESDSSESSDSEDYDEEEEIETGFAKLQRVQSRTEYPSAEHIEEEDEEEYKDDGEEDYAQLSLQRTWSHSPTPSSPPELTLDLEEDYSSEDEHMPPSPPTDSVPSFTSKSTKEQASLFNDGFYLPKHSQQPSPRLISAISVY